MIEIEISNMLRVKQAKILLKPGTVSCISGPNESGKTSVAMLSGAILARKDHGTKKVIDTSSKMYLHDDADAGFVSLSKDGDPVARWDAVSGQIQEFNEDLSCSEGAVGLIDFLSKMTPQTKTALWESYFLPPFSELSKLIEKQLSKEETLNEDLLNEIMELINEGEMKSVSSAYEKRRRDAKQLWKSITGEDYGIAKAADWIPQGWSADIDSKTEQDLIENLEQAKADFRSQQITEAITEAEIEEAQKASAKMEELEKELVRARGRQSNTKRKAEGKAEKLGRIRHKLQNAQELLVKHNVLKPKETATKKCGKCGASLLLVSKGDTLPEYDEDAYAEMLTTWETRRDELEKLSNQINDELNEFTEKYSKPLMKRINESAREVENIKAQIQVMETLTAKANRKPCESNYEQVQLAEKEVEHARKQLELWRMREQAKAHHHDVLAYDSIINILGPKGVRATTVAKGMHTFRAVLERVAQVTDWSKTEIDNSYNISIGGRKFLEICGETPRLRAKYAVQIAIAIARGEKVVILDMVDHLEHVHQQTLNKLLRLICAKDTAPAFLLCGTDGHFNPDLFKEGDDKDGTFMRIVEGDLQETSEPKQRIVTERLM